MKFGPFVVILAPNLYDDACSVLRLETQAYAHHRR